MAFTKTMEHEISMVMDTEPDFGRSALITVDIQNDTLDDQPFGIKGTYEIIPNVKKMLEAYRGKGKAIIHVIRIYKRDGSNADLCRREAISMGRGFLLEDERGAEPVHELLPAERCAIDFPMLLAGGIQKIGKNEVLIYKPRWGAFYKTPLGQYLGRNEIDTLVIAGCNFPNCPRTTIYEASERDFKIVAARDAISGIYELGIRELRNIGVKVLSSGQIVDQL